MMAEGRLHINVSAVDYEKANKVLTKQLVMLEQMVHTKDEFTMTDSEFAFGWHFFVLSVNHSLIQKLREIMGPVDYDGLKGKGIEKKFLTWLSNNIQDKDASRVKLAIKEEMESSKFGIF